jgi:hypothetical protein
MRNRFATLATLAALALAVLAIAPQGAAAHFDRANTLDLQVKLTQPALCDGSVKLAPGTYDVHFTTSEDGAVSAAFFQGGVKRGTARGTITVRKAGGEARAHTFASLGFNSSSPSSLKLVGQKLSLEIGAPGANQVFIWFEPAEAKH